MPFSVRNEMNINVDYLAAKYNEEIGLGYVDCSVDKGLCERMNVRSFPWIKYIINNAIHDFYGRQSLRSLIDMCDSLNGTRRALH